MVTCLVLMCPATGQIPGQIHCPPAAELVADPPAVLVPHTVGAKACLLMTGHHQVLLSFPSYMTLSLHGSSCMIVNSRCMLSSGDSFCLGL